MSESAQKSGNQAKAHGLLIGKLATAVIAMFGFGYLMVPIYDVFCDITGLNGKVDTVAASQSLLVDKSRTVTVEFDATGNEYLPFEFTPEFTKIKVHPGEMRTVYYKVRNTSEQNMIGQAVPSVAPSKAAEHLKKTECFCFTQQKFAAGEVRDMPVTFYLDTELPEDVSIMTLSYTFFDVGKLARNSASDEKVN